MANETTSSSTTTNEKIVKVLQKFLQPTFKIKNDVYLNQFLTHLVGKNDDDKIWKKDQDLQEKFCQWIIKASILWDVKKVKPQPAVLSFTLNLASHLSTDEQIFVKLNCQNVYESLVGVTLINLSKDPSVTLGLVTLLCSFLEHKSGLQWGMATTHWTGVINLGLKAHTMYIRKKSYQFAIKLLEKTVSFNRNFAFNLVEILIKPFKDLLRSLPSSNDAPHAQIESRELYESLKPSMDMILEVVETMLKRCHKPVIQLFLEQELPETIDKFLLLSRNQDFSFELLRIQFVFLFYALVTRVEGKKVVSHDALSLFDCKLMFNLIRNEMDKSYVRCVIKICDYAHEVFCSLEPRIPTVVKKGKTIEFQIQLMFLQITPIFGFSFQMISEEKMQSLLNNDVFRTSFLQRWLKLSAVQNIEICYRWAEELKEKPDLVEDVIFSMQYIVKVKRLLNKDRASTIFPSFVFSLTDAMYKIKHRPNYEMNPRCSLYLRTVVDTIVDLVECFDITWKDSVETICVMDLAFDLLQYPHWIDNRITIKGLKLLNLAITKYMSPDMVLLIYNTDDSKVAQTGSLLYAKCHDSSWEIRDSALEVVCTLSMNANTKFPAYTTILLNVELPQLVMQMALKDGESYVRVTAFKCLQELIQICEIWKILLNMDKFLENILDVFEKETEGIVRKEAASLIYKIVKFQNFPEEMLPRLYDVMTHAAIGDLHWEVKYNSLDFWFNLWEQHLIHQGMIDHTFPTHTFSKEHKKIVALNEAEVRKRIVKVLNQLSHIGCLHVMKCAVKDDCDIEVSKKATSFTFSMLKMFKIYKVSCKNADLSQPPSPVILQKNLPDQESIEPVSPASSDVASDSSPASIKNLGSPQFANSPFFDPLTPFAPPFSPSLELGLLTPASSTSQSTNSTNQDSPQQNQTPFRNSFSQPVPEIDSVNLEMPIEDALSTLMQPETPFSSILANEMAASMNLPNGMDVIDYEDIQLDTPRAENVDKSSHFDPARADLMLEEFLNSNDMTLLQGIYHPTDQVTNNNTQMKKKTYLAPSLYLRFVYLEVEKLAMEKTQWLNSLDEFDSLLDDILKEYNIVADVNSMDCY